MTINELLSKVQKLKNDGKIKGNENVLTFDSWKENKEEYMITNIEITKEGNLLLI